VTQKEVKQSQYWIDNLTSPVKFSEAISLLYSESRTKVIPGHDGPQISIHPDSLLEIGPHSALQGPIREILNALPTQHSVEYFSCLKRLTSSTESFAVAVGKLHCGGHAVDFSKLNELSSPNKRPEFLPDLPGYPFNHSQSYWFEGMVDKGSRFRTTAKHDLLGTRVPDWTQQDARWRHNIKVTELPWVKDHVVNGVIIYPATGMIVMAIEAAKQASEVEKPIVGFRIRDLQLETSLVIPSHSRGLETMFSLRPVRDQRSKKAFSWSEFVLRHYNANVWTDNCRGFIKVLYSDDSDDSDDAQHYNNRFKQEFDQATRSCNRMVDTGTFYNHLRKCGIEYGPTFQSLVQPYFDEQNNATSDVQLFRDPEENQKSVSDYTVHPASLDAIFHLHYAGVSAGGTKAIPTMIPTKIRKLWISAGHLAYPQVSSVQVLSKTLLHGSWAADSSVLARSSTTREPKILAEGIEVISIAEIAQTSQLQSLQRYHRMTWKPDVSIMSPKDRAQVIGDSVIDMPEHQRYFDDLTHLVVIFASETLHGLADLNTDRLEPSHLRKYLRWLKLKLDEFYAGSLPGASLSWKETLQDKELRDRLCHSVASYSSQGKLVVEVGERMQAILRQELTIHEVMFGGDLATNFYEEYFRVGSLGQCFPKYLDALAHKFPNIRILEIGAGTGGATKFLLKILESDGDMKRSAPRYSQYDFTDISPSFFEKARERFPEHVGRMKFRLFDIEADPLKQHLEASYDLILAFCFNACN
jgi:acyl transferase domain-containing protein